MNITDIQSNFKYIQPAVIATEDTTPGTTSYAYFQKQEGSISYLQYVSVGIVGANSTAPVNGTVTVYAGSIVSGLIYKHHFENEHTIVFPMPLAIGEETITIKIETETEQAFTINAGGFYVSRLYLD